LTKTLQSWVPDETWGASHRAVGGAIFCAEDELSRRRLLAGQVRGTDYWMAEDLGRTAECKFLQGIAHMHCFKTSTVGRHATPAFLCHPLVIEADSEVATNRLWLSLSTDSICRFVLFLELPV